MFESLHINDDIDVTNFNLSQYGFNMVMSHPHAVNEIALSLNNRNPRSVQKTNRILLKPQTQSIKYNK